MSEPRAEQWRILVGCHGTNTDAAFWPDEVAQGLQRAGHGVVKCGFSSSAPGTVSLAEARRAAWTAVIVSEARCAGEELASLPEFCEPQFGVRIQLVFDGSIDRAAHLDVNRKFAPHIVLFDDQLWAPGSFTDFTADCFHLVARDDASRALLAVIPHDGRKHYTYWPELGLYGKWPRETRLEGLECLFDRVRGASVLDLGAAEGVIARELLSRGAAFVHGFDLNAGRVATARSLCHSYVDSEFRHADLADWSAFQHAHADLLEPAYDVVLYLGLHHHLPTDSRLETLCRAAALARHFLAIRTTDLAYEHDSVHELLTARGFALAAATEKKEAGAARIYARREAQL